MARRGENIYFRKDGRWEGRYIKGRTIDRKPIYGFVYARKYYECKEKLVYAKSLCLNENIIEKKCGTGTVTDFMTYWLNNIVRQCVKASTLSNYTIILNKWINPYLGSIKLCKLEREDVQHFVKVLSEYGLSAGSVRNIYRVLYSAMKKAQEYSYLHKNPCEGISLPEIKKREARLLSLSEQKKLEQVAKNDKNGLPIMLAIYTGMRVGEICALKWSDVDLECGILHISETIQRVKNCLTEAPTKTMLIAGSAKSQSSTRIIPLPTCILELFRGHKKISSDEYVFTYCNHPLEPRLLQYRFKAMLSKAELEDINFHALRHTFATRCLELSFDVKTLSEILGHASAKMTLDRYSHSQLEHKRAAMKSLDQLFEGTA